MTRYNCDICQGRGKISVPVRRPLDVCAMSVPVSAMLEVSHRDYPCPECSDVTPVARVHAVQTESFVASYGGYVNDPEFIDHVQRGLAHYLADYLLRHDYIEFKRGPEDREQMRWEMVATIGVVPKTKLDDLEQRIAARQLEIANEAIAEAKAQVSSWGSYYGHSEILKRDALRLIGESVQRALDKRAAFKVIPGPKRGEKA